MAPLINILIRVSRPILFERCIESVRKQTYKHIFIHLYSCHDLQAYNACYAELFHKDQEGKYDTIGTIAGVASLIPKGFEYNLYCNTLKKSVKNGWFFYLDDDDRLAHENVLQNISEHLTDEDRPVICQMLRNGKPKPADMYMDRRSITKGRIGMPCFFLHAKHKDIAEFGATEDADFRFIEKISQQLNCKFVKQVVVDAGGRSFGEIDGPNFRYTSNDLI